MSEGTKLGEFKESTEFNAAVKQETATAVEEDLKATKMGEVSDFEKSLYEAAGQDTPESDTQSEAVPEEATAVQEETTEAAETAQPDSDADLFQQAVAPPAPASSVSTETPAAGLNEFQTELERLDVDIQEGDIVTGTVRSIEKGGVFVDIGYKSDGFIPQDEFSNDPKVSARDTVKPGDEISAHVTKIENKEGYTLLSRKRAEYEEAWNKIGELSRTKDTLEVYIASKVQGGLVADFMGLRGFIPASHVSSNSEEELDQYIGKNLVVSVLRADRKRRKIIFSHKLAKNRASRADAMKLMDELEIGQVREGKVASLKDFGAFIDLGGIEGLVHISELSWSRVGHPSDILNVGDDVKVFILGVDKDTRRISLGMKQLETDPWVTVAERYNIGDIVNGVVTRVVTFGAFVRLENQLEGLIHISELSYDHVKNVEDVVASGQDVTTKIIKIIPDEQKIGLSLKGASESESTEAASEVAAETEAAPEEASAEATTEEVATEAAPEQDVAEDAPQAEVATEETVSESDDAPQA